MPNESIVLKFESLKVNVHLSSCTELEMKCMFLLITQLCFGRGEKILRIVKQALFKTPLKIWLGFISFWGSL